MISLLVSAVTWCASHWKMILTWSARITGTLLSLYSVFWAFAKLSDWLTNKTADVVNGGIGVIDSLTTTLSEFVSLTGVPWIDGILQVINLEYGVTVLVGVFTFIITVVGWTLTGIIVVAAGYALRMAYIKWQKKQFEWQRDTN